MFKRAKKREDKWMQGFACACAITLRNHDEQSIVRDTYMCNFMNMTQLRKAGVSEYDIEILKPVIKEIQRRNKKNV